MRSPAHTLLIHVTQHKCSHCHLRPCTCWSHCSLLALLLHSRSCTLLTHCVAHGAAADMLDAVRALKAAGLVQVHELRARGLTSPVAPVALARHHRHNRDDAFTGSSTAITATMAPLPATLPGASTNPTEALPRMVSSSSASTPCSRPTQRPQLTVILSRYEFMVDDFSGWLSALLGALPDGVAHLRHRTDTHAALHAHFASSFTPDGGHKHALRPGANLATLSAASLNRLRAVPSLASVVSRLGYGWEAAQATSTP